MAHRHLLVLLALTGPLLAGCFAAPDAAIAPLETRDEETPRGPAVVVADIGPGVNPYHESFRRPDWTEHPSLRIPGFPANATALNLTLGDDYAASRKADEAVWNAYETGVLYWVPGTNLLLLTTREKPYLPDGNANTFHGTGSADAVNQACPDCYVLAVMDGWSLDGTPLQHIADELPWVDFAVSTNVPGDNVAAHLRRGYHKASKAFSDTGRLFFGFSGNSAVAAEGFLVYPGTGGPHHNVLVGGAHSDCQAHDLIASKPVEFVGNFTQRLAKTESVDEWVVFSGVSFATPAVAGAFGNALLQIRRALPPTTGEANTLWSGAPLDGPWLDDGKLTGQDLRHAMSLVASWFPTTGATLPCSWSHTAAPVSPTPWIEMGWGYVGPQEAQMVAAVVLGEAPLPQKPAPAVAYMNGLMLARRAAFS